MRESDSEVGRQVTVDGSAIGTGFWDRTGSVCRNRSWLLGFDGALGFDWMSGSEIDDPLMDTANGESQGPESMEALVNEVEKLSVSLGGPGNAGLISPEGGLLLGSLYSNRSYAPKTLERIMVSLWRPVYDVRMVEQERNILLFSFENKVGMQRVLDDGPGRFDDHFLLLKEISDPASADRELLRNLPIWVQVHDVPFQWLTITVEHAIADKLGEVLKVDENSEGVTGLGFLRARIEIDVAEPLPRKMQVYVGSGSFWVKFKFERLPNFCYRCGMVDHTELYCKKPVVRDENGRVQVWEQ